MKQENQLSAFAGRLVGLASDTTENRISVLKWLDELTNTHDLVERLASRPLDPSDDMLIAQRDESRVHLRLSHSDTPLFSCDAAELKAKAEGLLNWFITQSSISRLDDLPPSLRRLLIWRQPAATASGSKIELGVLNHDELNNETLYFYRLVWQHYRSDDIWITTNGRAYFVIGRTHTERIGARTGSVRHRYNTPCLTDNKGRLYAVREDKICRLKADGQALWHASLEIDSLHQGLYTYAHLLVIPNDEDLTCVNAHTGKQLWRQTEGLTVTGLYGPNLIGITHNDEPALVSVELQSGKTRHIKGEMAYTVATLWASPNAAFLIGSPQSDNVVKLLHLDATNHTIEHYNLPPCTLLGSKSHAEGFSIVLRSGSSDLLCELNFHHSRMTLTKLPNEYPVNKIVHATPNELLLLVDNCDFVCLNRDDGSHRWTLFFAETTLERLQLSCVHEDYLLVPSTPPKIIHWPTGRIVGTIDVPLYQHAVPLLIDADRIILKDDYGYIGVFELSGFIAPASEHE